MALTGFPSTDYSAHTLTLHIYDVGFIRFEMGYASALAVVLFAAMAFSWRLINRGLSRLSTRMPRENSTTGCALCDKERA